MAPVSMKVGQIRVLLADTQPQVRSALRILMNLENDFIIVGETDEARDMLAQIRLTRPDLVLLDWRLPGLSAIGFLSDVRRMIPNLKIIALSSHLEDSWKALAAGADVFISKIDPPDHLLAALRTINSNEDGDVDHLDNGGGQ